jgi:hypothetical protein
MEGALDTVTWEGGWNYVKTEDEQDTAKED